MTFILGLTGSIGMGKSTTAAMFAAADLPVWDADAAVHRLYAKGGLGASALAETFPQAVRGGSVSRAALRQVIAADPGALAKIEGLVHPLVAADRAAFLARSRCTIAVLDVPLLFETGIDALCHGTVCVTAPAMIQRARVLSRGGVSHRQLTQLLARQMPDAEKQRRATWIIHTLTLDMARIAVHRIIAEIRRKAADA
jgi:dephospho-CoA kinase